MLFNFLSDDSKVAIDVAPDGLDWRLVVDGVTVPLQASRDGAGAWLVDTHQGRRRLWLASRGDERFVFCDGKVHSIRLHDPEQEDSETDSAGGPNLVADMPGKVVQLNVKVGSEVAAGQTLMIIESMKMETELKAAMAGTVQQIHVTAGQLIGQGDPLLDIEEVVDASGEDQ